MVIDWEEGFVAAENALVWLVAPWLVFYQLWTYGQ